MMVYATTSAPTPTCVNVNSTATLQQFFILFFKSASEAVPPEEAFDVFDLSDDRPIGSGFPVCLCRIVSFLPTGAPRARTLPAR